MKTKMHRVFGFCYYLAITSPMMIAKVSANHRFQCEDAGDLNNYFINFCEEKCICEEIAGAGYDHVCYREREEFTCMSTARRERFLNAYKAVTTEGHPQYHQMKQLIESHGDPTTNFDEIHVDPYFLPWHRWFAMAVENILRNEDCRITLPWWRWSKKSLSWWAGSPFLPSDNWLGTNSFASCVSDGAFNLPWMPPTGDPETCLRRNFVLIPLPTGTTINTVLNLPPDGFGTNHYNDFSSDLEVLVHNKLHTTIRGDMLTRLSPREPAFFLHHGYIDQLWDRWQRKSDIHLNVYCSGCDKDDSLPHIVGSTPGTIRDNFDLKLMRVKYVNIKSNVDGRGHLRPFPLCLMVRSKLKNFRRKGIWDYDQIEMALAARNDEMILTPNDVPQLEPETPNFKTLRERFSFWYTRGANVTKLDEKIKKMVAIKRKLAKTVVNPITEKELLALKNPASYMLGYNLNSTQVKEALNKAEICPLGYVWTGTKGCRKEKKLFQQLQKELRKGKWVGGEIIAKEDRVTKPV